MTSADARLRDVPWHALHGLGPTLAPALDAILANTPAEDVLHRLLRANPHFTAEQRRACAEALFGVGLWRRRLQAIAGTTAPSLVLLGLLARTLGGASNLDPHLDTALPPPTSEPSDWRIQRSIPDWLASELEAAVGDEAPTLADAFNCPGPVTVRTNRLRCTREELRASLDAEGRRSIEASLGPDALHVITRPANLTATTAWRRGWFEVQDEGSQLLAACVPATASDVVLDLCAGAGGKTLALASRLPGVTLHAFDLDRARLDRLRTRASRAGAAVHVHLQLPDALRVHHVLVDAPCSELGTLRRGPDLRWRLDPASFARWPKVQRELLHLAARHLLPGGSITYATCTTRAEENESLIEAFLAEAPRFSRAPPALDPALLDARGQLRLWPHRHVTDGFFAAVLRG